MVSPGPIKNVQNSKLLNELGKVIQWKDWVIPMKFLGYYFFYQTLIHPISLVKMF